MQESEASKVAIFAVADYAWNVKGFEEIRAGRILSNTLKQMRQKNSHTGKTYVESTAKRTRFGVAGIRRITAVVERI